MTGSMMRPCAPAPMRAEGRAPVHMSRRRGRCAVVVRADGDYYDLLGVPKGSDKKAIKTGYRQMARKFHPVSIFNVHRGP